MYLFRLILAATVLLTGCSGNDGDAPDETAGPTPGIEIWTKEGLAQARAIYRESCASCHDTGASGAPVIGVREDWDGRSRMWVTVLTEHARLGYLQMPARGGNPALTDREVAAASEYMLSVTYPELPLDD